MTTANSTIGSMLKTARVKVGMTLADVSRESGYSKALISRIENGNVSPSINSLTLIANAVDVKLTSIFGRIEETDRPIYLKANEMSHIKSWRGGRAYAAGPGDSMLLVKLDHSSLIPASVMAGSGQKRIFVKSGQIVAQNGSDKVALKSGDCATFMSSMPEVAITAKKKTELLISFFD